MVNGREIYDKKGSISKTVSVLQKRIMLISGNYSLNTGKVNRRFLNIIFERNMLTITDSI